MGKTEKGPEGLSVVLCLPGEGAKHVVLGGDHLEGLQGLVGGYIEKVGSLPFSDELVIDVYCNEEGMMHGLPSNRLVYIPSRGTFPVLGPIVLAGANPQTGENVSLNEYMVSVAAFHAGQWPQAPKEAPVFKVTVIG